jgi:hypothetical protein
VYRNAYKTSQFQISSMASFCTEEAEIERQLINDNMDCGTDDSESGEEARGSETGVDQDQSSEQSA